MYWNDYYDDDNSVIARTPRKLERLYKEAEERSKRHNKGFYDGGSYSSIDIELRPDSDIIEGMVRIVEQHSNKNMTFGSYNVRWDDNYNKEGFSKFSPELFAFIKAIGKNTSRIGRMYIDFPLATEDMFGIVKALKEADSSIETMNFESRSCLKSGPLNDGQALLKMLDQASQWRCLRDLILEQDVAVGSNFLEGLAEALPTVNLKTLSIRVKACPETFEPASDSNKIMVDCDAIQAIEDLEHAIQKNLSLTKLDLLLSVGKTIGPFGMMNGYLGVMNDLNITFDFFCFLNKCGRKHLLKAEPQHHETWLARLGDVDELLRGGGDRPTTCENCDLELSAFYYYLRTNSWLFEPPKDLLREITNLRKALAAKDTELENTKKRHQSELESINKRHRAELLQANIQRLIGSQRRSRSCPLSAAAATAAPRGQDP